MPICKLLSYFISYLAPALLYQVSISILTYFPNITVYDLKTPIFLSYLNKQTIEASTSTMATSEAFQKAAEDSKKLTSKPDNQELLDLYGAFPEKEDEEEKEKEKEPQHPSTPPS